MAADLKSYVDKFILNPSAPLDIIDEDGLQVEPPVIISKVAGKEGSDGTYMKTTKLKIKNTSLLGEKDPRYEGKKVCRKSLKDNDDSSYDHNLSKYFLIEDDGEETEENIVESDGNLENECDTTAGDIMMLGEDEDEHYDSEDGKEGGDTDDSELNENNSSFCSEGDTGIDTDQDNEIESASKENKILTFSEVDTNEIEKGAAVKNQHAIFDTLFEARIGMQKLISLSNQLPQHNTYNLFLNEDYPHFKSNLQNARKKVKQLVGDLLNLQESLFNQNSETDIILNDQSDIANGSDEEIFNNEEESHLGLSSTKQKKRKRRLVEEYGEIINKRQKAMIPYRDDILNKWHGKTNFLVNRSRGSKFANFDISPVQQIKNILANKSQLIERTQLQSLSRGNIYSILGKNMETKDATFDEIHDPEIFDDSDFYTRMLEEVLKSKMSLSDDMTDVTSKWLQIQNLRKKSHKKVDRKASKGRKVRFEIKASTDLQIESGHSDQSENRSWVVERMTYMPYIMIERSLVAPTQMVMSKMQQFSAPCHPSLMDDTAINMLYTSVFGNCSSARDLNKQ